MRRLWWTWVGSWAVGSVGYANDGLPSTDPGEDSEAGDNGRSWDGSLSASGSVDAGNLDQLRAQLRAHLSNHGLVVNNELEVSAVVVWLRPPGGDSFSVLNRQITISEHLSRMVSERWQVSAFGRYEPNNIRGIRHRGGVGIGVGATLCDHPTSKVRVFVSGFVEGIQYRSADFVLEPTATSTTRWGPRLATSVLLNASSEDRKRSLRGSVIAIVNPIDTREFRLVTDATANARIWGPLGVNASATWTYDPFRLVDVQPHDVQATIGISMTGGRGAASSAGSSSPE